MATVTLLAWSEGAQVPPPSIQQLVEEHGGRFARRPGLALFNGTSAAIATAIDWQRAEQESPTTALAVHVAKLEYRADSSEPAPILLRARWPSEASPAKSWLPRSSAC